MPNNNALPTNMHTTLNAHNDKDIQENNKEVYFKCSKGNSLIIEWVDNAVTKTFPPNNHCHTKRNTANLAPNKLLISKTPNKQILKEKLQVCRD